MILGGLAANTGFGARDLDAMTAEDAQWWWRAIAAYNEAAREATAT